MEELSTTRLAEVTGGNLFTRALGTAARFVPGLNALSTAWDAWDTFSESRSNGRSVGQSLGDAALGYVKGWYDLAGVAGPANKAARAARGEK
jgi:hypothetical protein